MRDHATVSSLAMWMNQFRFGSRSKMMYIARISLVLLVVLGVQECNSFEHVFGTIKSGFEMAGKFLGLDRASGVAQLVSEAFGRHPRKDRYEDDSKNTIFSGFLRVLGLDSKRIGAIAVNAIIFIAQVISTSLSHSPPPIARSTNMKGTPLDWMLEIPQVQNILSYAKDANLPHHIIEYLDADAAKENSGCMQLLVCKSAPLVWGMQRALNAKGDEVKRGIGALTAYLPTIEEYAENGDECESKHPYCMLYY